MTLLSTNLFDEITAVHRDISDADLRDEIRARFPDGDTLRLHLSGNNFYADFIHSFPPTSEGIRILDVGCGEGLTSVYLASIGYVVTGVEPSPYRCRCARILAEIVGVSIRVVETTGEGMADALPGDRFDAVMFHSALHHCDDPVAALRNAKYLLKEGGAVYLICEPCLPFIRSVAWWQRMRKEHPDRVGEYGGNEHIYRTREYVTMLRMAGYADVTASFGPSIRQCGNYDNHPTYVKAIMWLFARTMRTVDALGVEWAAMPVLDRLSLGTRIFSGVNTRPAGLGHEGCGDCAHACGCHQAGAGTT